MSRRRATLVTYDIADPRRLRQVYKTLRAYGEHLQYSVFRCELTDVQKINLETLLSDIIHHEDDQVLFIDLGPAERGPRAGMRSLGRPMDPRPTDAVVL